MDISRTCDFENDGYLLCDIFEGCDFRTVEEFLDINYINEDNCGELILQNALDEYYKFNIPCIRNILFINQILKYK